MVGARAARAARSTSSSRSISARAASRASVTLACSAVTPSRRVVRSASSASRVSRRSIFSSSSSSRVACRRWREATSSWIAVSSLGLVTLPEIARASSLAALRRTISTSSSRRACSRVRVASVPCRSAAAWSMVASACASSSSLACSGRCWRRCASRSMAESWPCSSTRLRCCSSGASNGAPHNKVSAAGLPYLVPTLVRFGARFDAVEAAVVGGQAAPGGELELPAVHVAGEHAVLDHAELRQVGLEVRAAALYQVAVQGDQLLGLAQLGVPALGVLEALGRQHLEPVVDVLVVGAVAGGLEAARQKQLVDPVFVVAGDARLHQGAVDAEGVAARLALPDLHAAIEEVDHHLLALHRVGGVQQHATVHPRAGPVGLRQQRLPPRLERADDVDLVARPAGLAPLDLGQLALLVGVQVGALVAEDRKSVV